MKLRINYVNTWSVAGELQDTGILTSPTRRMVEIELTPEQRFALHPQPVGESGIETIYEQVESMYLINEKSDYSESEEAPKSP